MRIHWKAGIFVSDQEMFNKSVVWFPVIVLNSVYYFPFAIFQNEFHKYIKVRRDFMFLNWTTRHCNDNMSKWVCFLVDSLFMCSEYLTVQKHRQTKGNFMPKMMFINVNVLWKTYISLFFNQLVLFIRPLQLTGQCIVLCL